MADPSSMQECVSYMNLVMSLAHHRVSVAQWWSVGAQNPKVWVLIIFCYVPRSWQDEKHLSQILFISSQLSDLRKGAFTNWRTLMNPSLFFSLFLVIQGKLRVIKSRGNIYLPLFFPLQDSILLKKKKTNKQTNKKPMPRKNEEDKNSLKQLQEQKIKLLITTIT